MGSSSSELDTTLGEVRMAFTVRKSKNCVDERFLKYVVHLHSQKAVKGKNISPGGGKNLPPFDPKDDCGLISPYNFILESITKVM